MGVNKPDEAFAPDYPVAGPGYPVYDTGTVGEQRTVPCARVAPPPCGSGTYVYDLAIEIEGLKPPAEGIYVAWLTLPNLSEVVRLGSLDELNSIEGRVHWNKFLVVISLEESDDPDQARWKGPIAFRGLSRSGLMHTMAGHGPFDQEPCSSFGFE